MSNEASTFHRQPPTASGKLCIVSQFTDQSFVLPIYYTDKTNVRKHVIIKSKKPKVVLQQSVAASD